MSQELPEFTSGQTALTLSDIARYRNSCSPYLTGESIDLILGESCRDSIDNRYEVNRLLPHIQLFVGLRGHYNLHYFGVHPTMRWQAAFYL